MCLGLIPQDAVIDTCVPTAVLMMWSQCAPGMHVTCRMLAERRRSRADITCCNAGACADRFRLALVHHQLMKLSQVHSTEQPTASGELLTV
jgi:hypothetical protein